MSARLDARMASLFALIFATAVWANLPAAPTEEPTSRWRLGLPETVGEWHAHPGVPESILPTDNHALDTIRRTYRRGDSTVWVAVARYRPSRDPGSRPAGGRVAAGWTIVDGDSVELDLGPLRAWRFRYASDHVVVTHWYHLGSRTLTSDYSLRLRLFADAVLGRSRELTLVRLAARTADELRVVGNALRPELAR